MIVARDPFFGQSRGVMVVLLLTYFSKAGEGP